jgi:predicted component of type VI protein secretion system
VTDEGRDVAAAVQRLRAQAEVLRGLYGPQGPIPAAVKETIEEKRRAADALERGLLERKA